jgi:hypothetical protein
MTKEELLTLRDILTDFRKGLVEIDYVEAHILVLIDEAREAGYHCDPPSIAMCNPHAGIHALNCRCPPQSG